MSIIDVRDIDIGALLGQTGGTIRMIDGRYRKCIRYRDHASVRLPGVLHTNVGQSKFGYRTF